ncbi:MAG: Gfo/Idh/MocA family oxidoreductase [Streptosporangiaceae bacterium]|nr:Gfo/Idh/MocA family oxidoreductase [Streptosporangiaceae bacterium]MBV9856995.1 Gfo/Idh/MocA family oxidoreductase [Streptosporangiaceae bacterium]
MRIGLVGVGRIGAFHAGTLRRLPGVESVVVADADGARARDVARQLGTEAAVSVAALLSAGIDALVIATATATHPELIRRGIEAGLPVFCEKPVAPDVDGTLEVVKYASGSAAEVQIGFQRRFDAGFRAARDAAQSGALGWLHTIRSTTFDAAPPPAGYIPGSGGIFRDCAVHDFDAIRWVTGREVSQAYAVGANRGDEFFRAAGDVDTASAVLTLDDGTIAVVSCGRYNAAGYDVRLEVLGAAGSLCAGLDDQLPLRSAEPGEPFPAGPSYRQFMERFRAAYTAELAAFTEVAAGRAASPCTPQDALEAFYVAEACELSRRRGEPVTISEVRR